MQTLARISQRAYPTRQLAEDYVRSYVHAYGIERLRALLSEESERSTIVPALADAKVVAAILALGVHGASAADFEDLLRFTLST